MTFNLNTVKTENKLINTPILTDANIDLNNINQFEIKKEILNYCINNENIFDDRVTDLICKPKQEFYDFCFLLDAHSTSDKLNIFKLINSKIFTFYDTFKTYLNNKNVLYTLGIKVNSNNIININTTNSDILINNYSLSYRLKNLFYN